PVLGFAGSCEILKIVGMAMFRSCHGGNSIPPYRFFLFRRFAVVVFEIRRVGLILISW
ncbi:MAG: hypothetical protein JWM04_1920, partial [Verrucomicrobiales bacterium]|nr:hypothetical protein [Verrucomicrobiales bacterium]